MSSPLRSATPCNGSGAATSLLQITILILAVALIGCRETRVSHDYGTVEMQIGNRRFQLEIAATEKAREYGLMNRKTLAADRGMIFVFDSDAPRDFYMKNTLIPLDIVYVDSGGSVVSIKHGKPREETPTIASDGPMKYAIELNLGTAAAVGLRPGDRLVIPPDAKDPTD